MGQTPLRQTLFSRIGNSSFFGLRRLGHTVEKEKANFGLIISFVLDSLCLSEREGRKEDKGKLGSSLLESRLGNYPNFFFVYVWVKENPNSHYKGILVGSRQFCGWF